jgi:NADPH-dependent glutamate synthase beta subunit-like oxidoreductase
VLEARCEEGLLHLSTQSAECPARTEEVHHAEEEGVEFHWLTNPVEILDDGKGDVRGMRCVRMELAEPDDSGRRRPIAIAGSEHDIDVDLVVFAIGTNANPIMGQTSKLRLNSAATSTPTPILRPPLLVCSPAGTSSPALPR